MGCGGGQKQGSAASKAIDSQIRQDMINAQKELKLLLLGAGQSGKSTIAKQFKILHTGNYDEDELTDYKEAIHENTLSSIKAIVGGAEEMGIKLGDEVHAAAKRINDIVIEESNHNIVDFKDDIKVLWADKGIKEAYGRSREFQLNDNAKYCLDNIDRIADPNFVPNQIDVLHTRVRTTGVIEIAFELGDRKVRLVDVGGQRAERRKWMSCFEDVSAILFCVALSEYDLRLLEDNETNRTQESMKIFQEVTSKWFPKSTIILFLNKRDLFEAKIAVSPLKNTFPDYNGPDEFQPCCDFIRDKFLSLDPNAQLNRVYPHVTCATDTDSIRVVFSAVQDVLLKTNLETVGLM